jgi:hypothetical protein
MTGLSKAVTVDLEDVAYLRLVTSGFLGGPAMPGNAPITHIWR